MEYLGWYWVKFLKGNIISYTQVQVPHLGLMRICLRLRMDKNFGFRTIVIQVLTQILQEPGTTTVSVWGCNISNKPSSLKVGFLLHLLQRLIPSSVLFRKFQILEGWGMIRSGIPLLQSVVNIVFKI